ncbi:hypothetical protein LPJ75_002735 [Coemansia sp. RSA 2598]|nr:hypothetical protein LPJ75_002735 [Coemansia sp. RSA 2598]
MPSPPPTLDSAWDDVLRYLQTTKPSSGSDGASGPQASPSFILEACNAHSQPQPLALPNIASSSPLSIARRRRQQNHPDISPSQPKLSSHLQSPLPPQHHGNNNNNNNSYGSRRRQPNIEGKAEYKWAATLLSSLSDMDSPDFSTAANVWRLPNTELSELCRAHLCLDNCSATALSTFIKTVVSDPSVSLENQLLLLHCASASTWFVNKDAVPAILQSQIAALLQHHSQAIVSGLLLPQLETPEKMFAPLSAMITKLVKADGMPVGAIEALCDGIASMCLDKSASFNEHTFQVMEALLGVAPADRSYPTGWLRRWTEVLLKTAPVHTGSKKLGAIMLHFVNKFGSRLDKADLHQIAAAAGYLTTPLKKAIVATTARKMK